MSPINSNSSGSDFEAIHRAQRAHEPSMEEILASIRNIIADDPAKGPAPKASQPGSAPQIVYSEDAEPGGDASGSPQHPDARPLQGSCGAGRKPSKPSPQPTPANPARSRCCRLKPNEAVALSFGALSANLEARSG